MRKRFFYVNDISELFDVSKEILLFCKPSKKFLLFGKMGIGKTTLIKSLSLHLGVQDIVSSPTFSIVNEYRTKANEKIYHFDFYRIKNEKEAYDMGYEEYFFSSAYSFIEWPEKISNLVTDDMVRIFMYLEEGRRIIEIRV